jgi:tetratricopeptide (TPR) repeat protein
VTPQDRDRQATRAASLGMAAVAVLLGIAASWGALSLTVGGSLLGGGGMPGGGPGTVLPPATAGEAAPSGAELAAAVAERPDDVVARLALAHHHFDESAFDVALTHYLEVLARQPANGRALARAGWIAYEGGEDELAGHLLERSLAAAPEDPEALWFLAQVRLDGLGDDAGAADLLTRLLDRDDLSPRFRSAVGRLAAAAAPVGEAAPEQAEQAEQAEQTETGQTGG